MEIIKEKIISRVRVSEGKDFIDVDLNSDGYVIDVTSNYVEDMGELLSGSEKDINTYCDLLKAAHKAINEKDE